MSFDDRTELDSAKTAYVANAGYEENASLTEARAFVTACRKLLLLLPKQAGSREGQAEFSIDRISDELDKAAAYVAANTTSSAHASVTRANLSNFRD